MSIVPDIPPKAWSFSAIVVGYLLIDDLTANEQNALGNGLMLTAQVLCTNAFYKQDQSERNNTASNEPTLEETVSILERMVKALNEEVCDLKNKIWLYFL